jgi:hypothetical protein
VFEIACERGALPPYDPIQFKERHLRLYLASISPLLCWFHDKRGSIEKWHFKSAVAGKIAGLPIGPAFL